ncbi:MAG: hypothetical protein FWE06_00680 [Oscillospiraceae bacterium]|nr:hypothetical protein [Oscillospiraceae bacterium]
MTKIETPIEKAKRTAKNVHIDKLHDGKREFTVINISPDYCDKNARAIEKGLYEVFKKHKEEQAKQSE